jgi:hypothetical protein
MRFFQFSKKQVRVIAIVIAATLVIGTLGMVIGVTGVAVKSGGTQTDVQAEQEKTDEGSSKTESKAKDAGGAEEARTAASASDASDSASSDSGEVQANNESAPMQKASADPESAVPNASLAPDTITCSVSVNCSNISNNIDKIDRSKRSLVPSDGTIMPRVNVSLPVGATAFDALLAATSQQGVHMEYTGSAAAKTVYIEGIGNIYQFDCGSTSGWLYAINGSYKGVGMSAQTLSDGDAVELKYTLDLGTDLGAPGALQ